MVDFLKNDPNPIINFYGGEPLLRIQRLTEDIIAVKREIPNILFVLQTNGFFIKKIPKNMLAFFSSILISIDGRPEITNLYRGKGTFETVYTNVQWLVNECKFKGEVIARMTISEFSDIYADVRYLLDPHTNPGLTHVHRQLDALWNAHPYEDFSRWIKNTYNKGITRLIQWWWGEIEQKGKIYGVVPFLGILSTLLGNEHHGLYCGAGTSSYTISTDGSIIFCPVCPEEPEAKVGTLESFTKIRSVSVNDPCTSCAELPVCGGRCLYINYFNIGSEKDTNMVCESVKYLIQELRNLLPLVKLALDNHSLEQSQFKYPELNNGCEIIP